MDRTEYERLGVKPDNVLEWSSSTIEIASDACIRNNIF
jgi:hypothetical protein